MTLRLRERVDTRLHEAARAQNLDTVRALLAAGASTAALDWEGRTSLHLCVAERLIEPLKVLLREPGAADVRDASDLSLLDAALLHGWRDGARAVLDAGASLSKRFEDSLKHIYSDMQRYPDVEYSKFTSSFQQLSIEIAMESGDMAMFEMLLHAAKRQGTLDELNGHDANILYSAIDSSNLPAVQILLSSGFSTNNFYELYGKSVLHLAVNDHSILKYLLDYFGVTSSMIMVFDEDGETPLHAAVKANNPESVGLLIDKYNDKRVKTNSWGATPLHYAAYYGSYEAAEVILEKDSKAVDARDDLENTPLAIAAKYFNRKIAELLLERGSLLSCIDMEGETVIRLICSHFYDVPSFFEQNFDKYITISSENKDNDAKISIDYRVITNEEGTSQINVLEEFVKCGQSRLLIHPLIECLLYLNWLHFLPLFYVLITVYTILLVSVNFFVIDVFYLGYNNTDTINSTFKMPGPDKFHGGAAVYWLLIVLMYGSISFLLLQELFSMYVKRWSYFVSLESWVSLCGLALCAGAPLAMHAAEPWPRHVACAALMLTWLQAMFLFSRLPSCGYYSLMLGKVALDMLKVLATAIFLVVGFAICFMIQFRWAPPFEDPYAALVKTLVMMSSEFDYENLFGEDYNNQLGNAKTIVRLLFLTFLIFVAVVLMNFMTGVAVENISELNKIGNIQRLEKQVTLLSSFHYLVYDGVFAKWLKKLYGDKMCIKSIYTYQGDSHATLTYISTSSEDSRQFKSSRLYNRIIETAGRNRQRAQIEKQNAVKKGYKKKVDILCNEIAHNAVNNNEKNKQAKRNKCHSVTLRQQINTLFNDRTKVTHEIEELKHSISQLSLTINRYFNNDVGKQIPMK